MNDQLKLLSDIINEEFTEILDGKVKTVHFHTIDGNTFRYHVENIINNIKGNFSFLKFQLSNAEITEPYLPFLNLISQFIKTHNLDIEKLLESANVYPLHRTIFKSCLNNISFNRKDEIIFDELSYEIGQIRESIAKLIAELSNIEPLIITITELQYASDSTILFIQSFEKVLNNGRVLFVFSYDRNYFFSDDDKNDNWVDFISFAEENSSIFDFDVEKSSSTVNWTTCFAPSSVEEMLKIGQMNLHFLCFHSAISCALKICDLTKSNTTINQKDLYVSATFILGDSHYYLSENDNAIVYYRMILEEAQKDQNIPLLSEIYRKIALAHLYKYDIETSAKLAAQSLKFTDLLQDELQLTKVYILLYLIADKRTYPIEKDLYFKLENLLKKYNLDNTYGYFLQTSYMYVKYFDTMEEVHTNCDRGIKISKRLQNKFALAGGFHKKSILFSYSEDYDSALFYLKKSRKLLLKLNEPLQIIRINNGIGYYCLNTEDYENAHRYYAEGIRLFSKVRDYNEVSSTLYNLCLLQFMGRDYKECIKSIDKLLQIMKISRMTYIPYRCKGDIPIMKAFCYFKIGEHFKALQLVNRVKSTPSITLTNEYHFIYSILEGQIYASDGQYEAAINCFQNVINEPDAKNKSRNIFLPVYYLEYGLMLLAAERKELAYSVLNTGIEYCSETNFNFYKATMENILETHCDNHSKFPFPKVNLDLESIVEIAKQGVTLNKLHKKIRDIEFLNKIQEMSSSQMNKQAIAENYLNLVYINFPCEVVFMYDITKDQSCCIASKFIIDTNISNPIDYIEKLDSLDEPVLLDLLHSSGNLNFIEEFSSIINIPVKTDGGNILGLFLATIKPENYFNSDDLNILSISTRQIVTIFSKIDKDQALLQMSRTDLLTGLNNRQALQLKLDEEMIKIKNSINRQKVDLSIMFIDLDNFKYYNDTFGHNVGDIVIQIFGNMLRREFISPDFIARFGGDEFVVILPGTDETSAKAIAHRVVQNIFVKTNFKDVLENALGYSVEIPEEKILTCSIGIAGYKFTEHNDNNLNTLMHNADSALYKAKSSGKNAIRTY